MENSKKKIRKQETFLRSIKLQSVYFLLGKLGLNIDNQLIGAYLLEIFIYILFYITKN